MVNRQVIWIDLEILLLVIRQKGAYGFFFKKVVPLVFASESVLFKSKHFMKETAIFGDECMSDWKKDIDLFRLFMIVIIDHNLSAVNEKEVEG